MGQQWVHIPMLPGINGAGPDQDRHTHTHPQSLTERKYPLRKARLLLCTTLINQIFLQEKSKRTELPAPYHLLLGFPWKGLKSLTSPKTFRTQEP